MARGDRAHPELHIVANASDPNVVWAAGSAQTTWVELGLGWRNDAATCPNCAAPAPVVDGAVRLPELRVRPTGHAQPPRGGVLVLDGRRVPLRLQLPGRWNLANAALAITAASTHFDVDPDGRRRGCRPWPPWPAGT